MVLENIFFKQFATLRAFEKFFRTVMPYVLTHFTLLYSLATSKLTRNFKLINDFAETHVWFEKVRELNLAVRAEFWVTPKLIETILAYYCSTLITRKRLVWQIEANYAFQLFK